MSSICLAMLVKDESSIIARCLDSVKSIIDSWVIIDTGSSDNTKECILSSLVNIPGDFIERPWVNFGHNRTELVQLAINKADYLLLLDADMEVTLGPKFNKNLDADGYMIRYNGSLDYAQQLLVRGDLDWEYVGATHEYIQSNQCHSCKNLQQLRITHHCDGSSRKDKTSRDIALLEQGLEEDPDNSRNVFYLSQSYHDAEDYESAKSWYIKRSTMGGWDQEVWYATYQVGEMCRMLDQWDTALEWYLKAYSLRPSRAEPLYRLIVYYASQANYPIAYIFAKAAANIPYPDDTLFIEKAIYAYLIKDQLAVCSYYVNRVHESQQLCNEILETPGLTKEYKQRILANRTFASDKTKHLVFGLGTGRCGTKSLQTLLNAQKNCHISHESIVSPWVFEQHYLDRLVSRIHQYPASCVGDVAFYYLNYVEQILKIYPGAKFICLQRDKQATVESYLSWAPDKNHWTHRDSKQWKPGKWKDDEYDDSYPKYMMPKLEAISAYWDDYYRYAHYLHRQYPCNFKPYPINYLNSRERQIEILAFIGCKPHDMILNVGIKENQSMKKDSKQQAQK